MPKAKARKQDRAPARNNKGTKPPDPYAIERHLESLSGGALQFSHYLNPLTFWAGYNIERELEAEENLVHLYGTGNLERQLIDECQRIGQLWLDIAAAVRRKANLPRWGVWMLVEHHPPARLTETDSEASADASALAFNNGDDKVIAVAIREGEPVPSWITAIRLQEHASPAEAAGLMLQRGPNAKGGAL